MSSIFVIIVLRHSAAPADGVFLSNADFDRAQNMSSASLLAQESAPMARPLNDPELYYEGDMMIQESDEEKVTLLLLLRCFSVFVIIKFCIFPSPR